MKTLFILKIYLKTSLHARMLTKWADRAVTGKKEEKAEEQNFWI